MGRSLHAGGHTTEKALRCTVAKWARGTKSSPLAAEHSTRRTAKTNTGWCSLCVRVLHASVFLQSILRSAKHCLLLRDLWMRRNLRKNSVFSHTFPTSLTSSFHQSLTHFLLHSVARSFFPSIHFQSSYFLSNYLSPAIL